MKKAYRLILLALICALALPASAEKKFQWMSPYAKMIDTSDWGKKVFADEQGHATIKVQIKVRNMSTVEGEDFHVGDPGYSFTVYFNDSSSATSSGRIVLAEFPIPFDLTQGEIKTADVEIPIDISGIIEKKGMPATGYYSYCTIHMHENMTDYLNGNSTPTWTSTNSKAISGGSYNIYPAAANFQVVSEYAPSTTLSATKPLFFGVKQPGESLDFGFLLKSTGTKTIVTDPLTVSEGFTATPAGSITVIGLAQAESASDSRLQQPFTVSLTSDTPGMHSGTVKVKAGDLEQTIPVSGIVGDGSNLFDFEVPEGQNAQTWFPKGWIRPEGSKWTITTPFGTLKNQGYGSHSLKMDGTAYSEEEEVISSRLRFRQGDKLTFGHTLAMAQADFIIFWSADRVNWTPIYRVGTSATPTSRTDIPNDVWTNATNDPQYFTVENLPVGEGYLKLNGRNVWIDNIYGGEACSLDHDIYLEAYSTPTSGMVNRPTSFSISATNLADTEYAAADYTVSLVCNGQDVFTFPSTPWEAGEKKTFRADYVPHAPASLQGAVVRIAMGEYHVDTPAFDLTIKEEKPISEVEVGVWDTKEQYSVPLNLARDNSATQTIFTPALLEKYGITQGKSIAAIDFDGYAFEDMTGSTDIKIWLLPATQASFSSAVPIDIPADAQPAYEQEGYIFTVKRTGGTFDRVLKFELPEPYTYTGGNLLMHIQATGTLSGTTTTFKRSNESKTATICAENNRGQEGVTFEASEWSKSGMGMAMPVFHVIGEPLVVSGTTTRGGLPVADAEITLTSGEVIYSGRSDESGAFSIPVCQPALDYQVSARAEGLVPYESESTYNPAAAEGVLNIPFPDVPHLRGTLTGKDGLIADYPISMVSEDGVHTITGITTDTQGAFDIRVEEYGVPYIVTIDHIDHQIFTTTVNLSDGKDKTLDIRLPDYTAEKLYTVKVTVNSPVEPSAITLTATSQMFPEVEYTAADLALDSEGSLTLPVCAGPHTFTLTAAGLKSATLQTTGMRGDEKSVDMEYAVTPYDNIDVEVEHDPFTGSNTVNISWTAEPTENGPRRSAANPYETFRVELDSDRSLLTEEQTCSFSDVSFGGHTVRIISLMQGVDHQTYATSFAIRQADYASLTLRLQCNDQQVDLDQAQITVTGEDGISHQLNPEQGEASIPSLRKGKYAVEITCPDASGWSQEVDLTEDTVLNPSLIASLSGIEAEKGAPLFTPEGCLLSPNSTSSDLKDLQPGIYIWGRKKLIIRH